MNLKDREILLIGFVAHLKTTNELVSEVQDKMKEFVSKTIPSALDEVGKSFDNAIDINVSGTTVEVVGNIKVEVDHTDKFDDVMEVLASLVMDLRFDYSEICCLDDVDIDVTDINCGMRWYLDDSEDYQDELRWTDDEWFRRLTAHQKNLLRDMCDAFSYRRQ